MYKIITIITVFDVLPTACIQNVYMYHYYGIIESQEEVVCMLAILSEGPTVDSLVASRFARAPYIGIVKGDKIEFEPNPFMNVPSGAGPQFAMYLQERGIEEVIAGAMPGPNASRLFTNVKVVPIGTTVKQALNMINSNVQENTQEIDNAIPNNIPVGTYNRNFAEYSYGYTSPFNYRVGNGWINRMFGWGRGFGRGWGYGRGRKWGFGNFGMGWGRGMRRGCRWGFGRGIGRGYGMGYGRGYGRGKWRW